MIIVSGSVPRRRRLLRSHSGLPPRAGVLRLLRRFLLIPTRMDILADDFDAWTLSATMDISADGNPVVGFGTNSSGVQEAWTAKLPERKTSRLLGIGLISLAAGRGARVQNP